MGKMPEKVLESCTTLATRPVETNEGMREMTNDPYALAYLKLNLAGSAGDEHHPYKKKSLNQ
jgi:hypothetical protein